MRFLLICILFVPALSKGQVYIGRETEISFFAKSTLEDISASNKSVTPVLNAATGELIIKIPNTGFRFPSALMQEHFNESYMESEKYPFSIFDGKINEPIVCARDSSYPVSATGKLTIHGVTKTVTATGTLTVKEKDILMHSEFNVLMTDYDIQVPGIKMNTKNDSEEVTITVHSLLVPYEK